MLITGPEIVVFDAGVSVNEVAGELAFVVVCFSEDKNKYKRKLKILNKPGTVY